jgi:hypothetical protein
VSARTRFDRTVDLEITGPTGESARGNETRGASTTIAGVPAYRAQVGAEEDTADRDQQARTFEYLLPPVHEEHDVAELLSGRDVIVDGDERLEVLGTPEVATSRGRRRHVLVRAYYVSG